MFFERTPLAVYPKFHKVLEVGHLLRSYQPTFIFRLLQTVANFYSTLTMHEIIRPLRGAPEPKGNRGPTKHSRIHVLHLMQYSRLFGESWPCCSTHQTFSEIRCFSCFMSLSGPKFIGSGPYQTSSMLYFSRG